MTFLCLAFSKKENIIEKLIFFFLKFKKKNICRSAAPWLKRIFYLLKIKKQREKQIITNRNLIQTGDYVLLVWLVVLGEIDTIDECF